MMYDDGFFENAVKVLFFIVVGVCLFWLGRTAGQVDRDDYFDRRCEVFEDGSADCIEGTFDWDCNTMGNGVCGPEDEDKD